MTKSYDDLARDFDAAFRQYGSVDAAMSHLNWSPEDMQTFSSGSAQHRPGGTYLGTGTQLPVPAPQSHNPLASLPSTGANTTFQSSPTTGANPTSGGGFNLPMGLTWSDLLKFGGTALGTYATYEQNKKGQQQQQNQFDQTIGLSKEAQDASLAMRAANGINRAPLADRGQYLALNAPAPTAFHPRDWTQGGIGAVRGQATGGAAAQLAANSAASANYKPGMGGVDTSTLQMILNKTGYGRPPVPDNPGQPSTTGDGTWKGDGTYPAETFDYTDPVTGELVRGKHGAPIPPRATV